MLNEKLNTYFSRKSHYVYIYKSVLWVIQYDVKIILLESKNYRFVTL